MSPDPLRQRIDEAFDQVVELPAELRARALAELGAESLEVQREVARLLAADDAAKTFLSRPVFRMSVEQAAAEPFPRRVGAYRLLRLLDHGGMGNVYLAAREDDSFERLVALKLIRRHVDSLAARERFRRERQILAGLEHPGIARLYDGGTTDDGQPWLVMELVEGEPIDAYCDHHRLGVEARLELFLAVAAAVTVAHRNLVVHRDLKPANILVTAEGRPKLLDFGIAKPLSGEAEDELTATGQRAMTPSYASPEQVAGLPITTASDVYALTVLLHRLLTGRSPYRVEEPGPHAVERAIMEQEIRKPSETALLPGTGLDQTSPEALAFCRGLGPRELSRRLAGDLDTLLLHGLRKLPHQRYGSVEALADDVQRHLAQLPIAARPATFTYRLGKLVRRNRLAVAAGSTLLVAAVTFTALLIRAERRTAAERDRAEEVSAFLLELFRVADPSETRGETVTARELLDQGVARIGTAFEDQPLLKARLLSTMATAYVNLGSRQQALPMLEDVALRLRREAPGSRELMRALSELGYTYTFFYRNEEARQTLEEAWALAEASGLGEEREGVRILRTLSVVHTGLRQPEAAAKAAEQALAIARRLRPEDPRVLADCLYTLADQLSIEGRQAEARPLLEQALDVGRRGGQEKHPNHLRILQRYGDVLDGLGDSAAARRALEEALALQEALFPGLHPDKAYTRYSLAITLVNLGEARAAVPLFVQAEDELERTVGADHPYRALSLFYLASLHLLLGDLDTAERHATLARELFAAHMAGHPLLGTAVGVHAKVMAARGDLAGAEALQREAVRVVEEKDAASSVPSPELVRRELEALAGLLLDQGQIDEAATWLERASRHVLSTPDHVAASHLVDARMEAARGRFDQALVLLERLELTPGRERLSVPAQIDLDLHRAAFDLARARPADAATRARAALARAESLFGPACPPAATLRLVLGLALLDQGEPAAAKPLLTQAAALPASRDRLPFGDRSARAGLAALAAQRP